MCGSEMHVLGGIVEGVLCEIHGNYQTKNRVLDLYDLIGNFVFQKI